MGIAANLCGIEQYDENFWLSAALDVIANPVGNLVGDGRTI